MTSIKIINDDVGLRGIQEGNKTPVISGPVMPVKASNPVKKSPKYLPLQSGVTERRNHEPHPSHRRHADRRKTESPVLLDTRSSHDRRTKTENDDDTKNTMHGIDEIV